MLHDYMYIILQKKTPFITSDSETTEKIDCLSNSFVFSNIILL